MSIIRQEGEFDVLYVATSEPSTKTDPSDSAYTRVGLVDDLSDELSNEAQSTLDRDTDTHEDVSYGQQSSSASITANVQEEDDGGTTTEDAGQIDLRDAAIDQDIVFWLINPEDGDGNTVTGLDGVHAESIVESFNYTRNAGEFKQFEVDLTNRVQPTFFTA